MRLALKDLMHSKLRFGLLAGAISLLVFLLLVLSTLSATLRRFSTGALEHNSAEVLVYDVAARGDVQASRLDPALADRVAQIDGVAAVAGVAEATVTASVAGARFTDLSLWGFVPGQPGEPANLVEGRMPGPGEALVDRADAGNGFRIGETITVQPSGRTLEIVGSTAGSRFGAIATASTPLEEWRDILAAQSPGAAFVPVNAVAVALNDPAAAERVAATIATKVPRVDALSREAAIAAAPDAGPVTVSLSLLTAIAFATVLLVVGFCSVTLTVHKLRTFTVLRALGAPTSYLAETVVSQIVALLLTGGAVATALLGVVALVASDSLPIDLDSGRVLAILLGVLVGSVPAGLASIRRIAGLDPASAAENR